MEAGAPKAGLTYRAGVRFHSCNANVACMRACVQHLHKRRSMAHSARLPMDPPALAHARLDVQFAVGSIKEDYLGVISAPL